MSEETITHHCAACLTMDRADGVEDGWLVPKLERRVKNQGREVKDLSRLSNAGVVLPRVCAA